MLMAVACQHQNPKRKRRLVMFYCGLDIAGVSSFAFVTDARGKKVASGPVATTRAALEARFKPYVRSGLAIAIEAGNQTAWIYEVLVALGAQVTVVNPTKVKLIAESRRKTDKIDAKILCELLRLGGLPEPVHMPDKQTRALRGLLVAAGGGPHQAVQRRARPAAPGGAAAAGPRPAEPGRLG